MLHSPFRNLTTALALAALATTATAQRWNQQTVSSVGLELRVPDTLDVRPLSADESDLQIKHVKYRFGSIDQTSHAGSGFAKDGAVRVLVFPKELSKEQKKDRGWSRNFEDFVRNHKVFKGDRTFHVEDDKQKGRGKAADHERWEYSELADIIDGADPITHYHVAGVYDFGDREIAVIYDFWAFDNRPDQKAIRLGQAIVGSVVQTEVVDASAKLANDPRARHADTPTKRKVVEAAAQRVLDLEGWDFFTTERFCVLYSHDDKPAKKKRAIKDAEELADILTALRDKFEEDWPPTEEQDLGYPILRVCHERDLYSPFGSSGEQVGRFIPDTGEVVIFNDGTGAVATEDAVRQIMIAAAWQQYAHAYWPDTPFQKWWLLGTADHYAQYEPRGRKLRLKTIENPYVYFSTEDNRFRLENPMALVNADVRGDEYVKLRDFVNYDDGKFDGARPANNRAQAYTFVDFLARGEEELGKRFDDSWKTLWRDYPATLAKSRSTTKTVEKVFEGVDFEALEEAWKTWIKKAM